MVPILILRKPVHAIFAASQLRLLAFKRWPHKIRMQESEQELREKHAGFAEFPNCFLVGREGGVGGF